MEFGGKYDVLLYSYPTGFWSTEDSLINIGERAREHFNQTMKGLGRGLPTYDEIYFITHSMGALVTQWAIVSMMNTPAKAKHWGPFLKKTRGFIFIAAPNGGLRSLIQSVGGLFNAQVDDIGPYGNFRDRLESMWVEAEKADKDRFFLLFRKNTALVLASQDNVINNATITERFAGMTPYNVRGGHISAVKVIAESDELFRIVIAPFLKERIPIGKGLTVEPPKLVFVTPDIAVCGLLTVTNEDKARINWKVEERPRGYFPSYSREDQELEPEASAKIRVARLVESSPAQSMSILWNYDLTETVQSKINIALQEVNFKQGNISSTSASGYEPDPCEVVARKISIAISLYEKNLFRDAYLNLHDTIDRARQLGLTVQLQESPSFAKYAGLISLQMQDAENATAWLGRFAERDELGQVYSATAKWLLGTPSKETRKVVSKPLASQIEITLEKGNEIKRVLPENALEKEGFVVRPVQKLFGSNSYKITKAVSNKSITFDTFKSDLSDEDKKQLDKFVETIHGQEDISVWVSGYADDRSSNDANLAIAKKRTESVTNYLEEKGVRPALIQTNSYGRGVNILALPEP